MPPSTVGRQGRAQAKYLLLLQDLDAVLQRDVDHALATGLGPASVGTGRIPDKGGQARGLRIIVGAESFVADVHLCQAAVYLVTTLVEPAADVPAVGLGCRHGLLAIGCQASFERRGQAGAYLSLLGLEPLPVLLVVARYSPLRLLVRLGPAPALLCLFGVILGTELAEDLEAFLRRQWYIHGPCLHFVVDCVDHRVQTLYPLGQQTALATQVPERIGAWIVDDGRDLTQGEPELPVEQDPLQPLEIPGLVDAVAGALRPPGDSSPTSS
jgi:hypothetical protein